jgi:hypothetical protein
MRRNRRINRMADEFTVLIERFRERLERLEQGTLRPGGSDVWRRCCLEKALEFIEEDPTEASKWLDEFDRLPDMLEVTGLFDQFDKEPEVKDIRARFDNLGGGIV